MYTLNVPDGSAAMLTIPLHHAFPGPWHTIRDRADEGSCSLLRNPAVLPGFFCVRADEVRKPLDSQ
jgi:hypothetical protein